MQHIDTLSNVLILVVGGYFALLLLTSIIRPLVFSVERVFRLLNWVQWIIRNPLRFFWKNKHNGKSHGFFIAITYTGISIAWWIISYLITLPFRFFTAVYYDVILFSAISLADNMDEFLKPKRGHIRELQGTKYVLYYILTFPYRFIKMIIKSGLYVSDSILMFGVSLVFPTLTMFHGTQFNKAGTRIAQSNNWKVGNGNYAGTGIYFGLNNRTAKHYAPDSSDNSMILARVTLTFCKTIATLNKDERDLVSLGSGGEQLARKIKGFYASTEHWREDLEWWEYCLLYPKKMDSKISTWRIRPVAIVHNGSIVRTWGGFAHYTLSTGLIAGAIAWGVIFFVLGKIL
jgi:hypothetical protein